MPISQTEQRLLDIAPKGLIKTVKNLFASPSTRNGISADTIGSAINLAIEAARNLSVQGKKEDAQKRWQVVKTLCTAPRRNDFLSQETIDATLNKAVESKQWDIVESLCSLVPPARIPSTAVVDNALVKAADAGEIDLVESICSLQRPAQMPSQKAIDKTLANVTESPLTREKWAVIRIIYTIENPALQPSQEPLDLMFAELAEKEQWKELRWLCENSTNQIKPSQMAFNYAIRKAASIDNWEVFKMLCSVQEPDWRVAGIVLQQVARQGKLDIVQMMCNLDSSNTPNMSAFKDALKIAKSEGNKDIAHYLSWELTCLSKGVVDPLERALVLLDDYVKHHHFFNPNYKDVKRVLRDLKIADRSLINDQDRRDAVTTALAELRSISHIAGKPEWKSRIDYIEEHNQRDSGPDMESSLSASSP